MRAFGIAFILWGGSILLCCGLLVFSGLFISRSFYTVIMGFIGFFAALFITSPLLLPATWLIKLASKIPYNETVRICWLGFSLILLNYLFFRVLDLYIFISWGIDSFFPFSAIAVVVMLIFKRKTLKEFFSQQTTKEVL